MLLKYEVSNFTVFKDNIEFSMNPGKVYDRFRDNVIDVHAKMKQSKLAVIFGENGSGKTNFMRSLHYLQYLIASNGPITSLKQFCHVYSNDEPQKFKIVVLIQKKIYTYELEIDRDSIVSEQFYYRGYTLTESKDTLIFRATRRAKSTMGTNKHSFFDIGVNPKIVPESIINKMNHGSNTLLLSAMSLIGVEEAKVFVDWIKDKLVIDIPSNFSLNIYKQLQNDEEDYNIMCSVEFLELFKLIDSSITAIEVDEKNPYSETSIIRFIDNKEFAIKLKHESSGINEFYAWCVQIYKVIYQDATLFADELDRVLNPVFASKILKYIKGSEHKGQFIFSTHNVLHLNTIDFMKEQIYFVSKDLTSLESEFYSLGDFDDYRYEQHKVYELYLKGLLGGVPNV